MTSEYPVEIEGDTWYPVPESWIEYGEDRDSGSPRIYAVSVADGPGRQIQLRYADRAGRTVVVDTEGSESPSGDGTVPASLANYQTWPRSMVPPRGTEPTDILRAPEGRHFRDLWSDRIEDGSEDEDETESDPRVVTDGGTETSDFAVRIDHPDISVDQLEAVLDQGGLKLDRVSVEEVATDGGERLPWCRECSAFANPDDGTCGECGSEVVFIRGSDL